MILTNVSASQVDSFDRCQRYWYNKSILKIPTPQTEPQKRGQNIHAAVENFLRHGTIDPEWKDFVEIAIPNLPPPKLENVLIEQKIVLPTFEGGPSWVGYVDLIDFRLLPVRVIDHKTIGNFKYMKTVEDLKTNTQLMSYAKWVMDNVEHDEVEVEHVYIGTKELKSKTVTAKVSRSHVESIWTRDVEKVIQMAAVAASEPVTAEALPPTYSACGMYGGCPYRSRCNISPLRGAFDMPDVPAEASAIMKKLAAAQAAAAAAAANGTIAPPIAAAVVPAVVEEKKLQIVVEQPAVPAPTPTPAPVAAPVSIAPPGQSVFEVMLKDKPTGFTYYNGGHGYTKLPDGSVMAVKMLPEDYAKVEAEQTARAITGANGASPPAAVPVAEPVPTPAPVPPVSALTARLAAAANGAATAPAPFLTQPAAAVVPPDAPPRTSTHAEVHAAENPTKDDKPKRGRPPKEIAAPLSAGQLVQLVAGDSGLLIGLDGVGQVWMLDTANPTAGWIRLPIPAV